MMIILKCFSKKEVLLLKLSNPSESLSKDMVSPSTAAANKVVLDSTFNHASSPKEKHISDMNLGTCPMVSSPSELLS